MSLIALCLLAAQAVAQPQPSAAPAPGSIEARARILALADAREFDAGTLRAFAASPDAAVREACARVLGELADGRAVALLRALSADGAPAVRAAAAEAAGRLASFLPSRMRERGELERLLEPMLRDREAAVRMAAAWAVGAALPAEGELWLLHRLSREPHAGVRAAILQELWRFPGKLWPRRVMPSLTDRDPGVRFGAAWSLARSARPDALAGLRRAARDADARVRMAALEGLRRLGPAEPWPDVVANLADSDRDVRVAALGALEAMAKTGDGHRVPDPAPAVTAMVLFRDPRELVPEAKVLESWGLDPRGAQRPDFTDAQERVAAIRAAGALRCCETALRSALAADVPWVSAEALGALVRQGASGAAETAAGWLAASDVSRRIAAVRITPSLPQAGRRLATAIEDSSAEVRLAAAETASEVDDPAVGAALARRLGDPDPIVRAAVVEALSRRKAAPAPAQIEALLGEEGGASTPDAAVALLEAFGATERLDAAAERVLDSCLGSRDPVVARAAWSVLARHGFARPLPRVATGKDAAFYRQVVEWAAKERYLLVVTVRGTLQVRLDTARAPLTCFRLVELADKHFFDGLTFHRVVANFVIQGGDPRGDGWGGPGYTVRDELSLEPYGAGAVGIALSGPDTGGSQFFVTMTRQPHLDGRYPRIGTVANGLDVASRIRAGDRILRIRAGEGALPPYLPVWYGPISPQRLNAEIPGWREEREKYRPQPQWLDRLRGAKLRYGLTIAMGTWCSDSIEQVPRLQAVLAALGAASPFGVPRLIGIDRTKVPDPALYKFAAVDLSPTIVVTAGGSEVGRIVETPKSGSIEEDLVRILAPIEGWELPEPSPAPAPGS